MKIDFLLTLFLAFGTISADTCNSLQHVQLHQFRDLFLYLFQNSGYLIDHFDTCTKSEGNDVYSDSYQIGDKKSSLSVGHNLIFEDEIYTADPTSLIITINDEKIIDDPYGSGWNGLFSSTDVDNILRSLLTQNGRKMNILLLNYIYGIGLKRNIHLISFLFEGEIKKRFFIVVVRPTSMSFIITNSLDLVRKLGSVKYSKVDFSGVSLHSNLAGIGFGFDKCVVSLKIYPEQNVKNLASCAPFYHDLVEGLWRIQKSDLDQDCAFLPMLEYFNTQYEKERKNFSLDLYNLLLISKFKWMRPIVFDGRRIANRIYWVICSTFDPKTYEGVRELCPCEKSLLTKMYDQIKPKCLKLKKLKRKMV